MFKSHGMQDRERSDRVHEGATGDEGACCEWGDWGEGSDG